MARIVIKDLDESTELDRKATKDIRGGARGLRAPSYRSRARGEPFRTSRLRFLANK